jgi:hypothetical protein
MLLGLAYRAQGSNAMIAMAKAELQEALDLNPDLLWALFYLARLRSLPESHRAGPLAARRIPELGASL